MKWNPRLKFFPNFISPFLSPHPTQDFPTRLTLQGNQMATLFHVDPSPYLEPQIMLSDDFNKITDIHAQIPLTPDMLHAVAKIFQKHDAYNVHGLQLLHRHYMMPQKCIALTTAINDTISVTKITQLKDVDPDQLRGQLYRLNDAGKFQAYEYEYGPPIQFSNGFLEELAGYIQANDLRDRIAIVADGSERNFPSREYNLGDAATVTVTGGPRQKESEAEMDIVGWRFQAKGGGDLTAPLEFGDVAMSAQYYPHRSLELPDEPVDLKEFVPKKLREAGYIAT
jgi:hypothetical protein